MSKNHEAETGEVLTVIDACQLLANAEFAGTLMMHSADKDNLTRIITSTEQTIAERFECDRDPEFDARRTSFGPTTTWDKLLLEPYNKHSFSEPRELLAEYVVTDQVVEATFWVPLAAMGKRAQAINRGVVYAPIERQLRGNQIRRVLGRKSLSRTTKLVENPLWEPPEADEVQLNINARGIAMNRRHAGRLGTN